MARRFSRKLMGLHAIRNTALRTNLGGHRAIAQRLAEEYRDKHDWLGIGVPGHLGDAHRPDGRKEMEWSSFVVRVETQIKALMKVGITRARVAWRGVRDKGRQSMLKSLKDGQMKYR